jgi:hypothetical protein
VALLPEPALRRTTEALLLVRRGALQRRAVRAAELRVHADDYDETAAEEVAAADAADAALSFAAVEAVGAMIQAHGPAYARVYAELCHPVVVDVAHPACLPADRQLGIFLADDALEYLGEAGVDGGGAPYAQTYVPFLLRSAAAAETHEACRQGALYGLGAAAAALGPSLAPHLAAVIAALRAAAATPRARRTSADDTAVTALGKVILHQYAAGEAGRPKHEAAAGGACGACPPRQALVDEFLAAQPLTLDKDEAAVAVQMLCALVDGRDVSCHLGNRIALGIDGHEHRLHARREREGRRRPAAHVGCEHGARAAGRHACGKGRGCGARRLLAGRAHQRAGGGRAQRAAVDDRATRIAERVPEQRRETAAGRLRL